MNQRFSYDNPMMTALTIAADMVILNLIFLLCCIPIITIGPAHAGLYTALRVLQNPNDGCSCIKAFFRGFKTGFGTISAAWTLLFLLGSAIGFYVLTVLTQNSSGFSVLCIGLLLIAVILMLWNNLVALFHSQFQCGFFQLLLNSLVLLFSHPLRAILACIITWAPTVLLIWKTQLCIRIFPLFFSAYFSLGYLLVCILFKKPFGMLIERFNNTECGLCK